MSFAIMYDPCHDCPHKRKDVTIKMCSMCELQYLRKNNSLKKAVEYEDTQCAKYLEEKKQELLDYVDQMFTNIQEKLNNDNK